MKSNSYFSYDGSKRGKKCKHLHYLVKISLSTVNMETDSMSSTCEIKNNFS